MANPRQRRKSRSSSYKPVSHSKNAKRNLKKAPPIRGPKALQEAWDKRKTVKQNYARLGLVHSLNPCLSGGTEVRDVGHQDIMVVEDQPPSEPSTSSKPLPQGFGRIIRDEAGNIIGVELDDDADCQGIEEREETMEDMEPEVDKSVIERWATCLGGKAHETDVGEKAAELLEELANISGAKHVDSTTLAVAHSMAGPNLRHPASGEIEYLKRLVEKHGDDVGRMAKDRKLNIDQKTEGQLRRALRNSGFLSGK